MKKTSKINISLFFWSMLLCSFAHSVELKPFTHQDTWTYTVSLLKPDRLPASADIQYGTIYKNDGGELNTAFASEYTETGEAIWETLVTVPKTSCMFDFSENTDLGLANSCNKGLKIGDRWQRNSDVDGEFIEVYLVVTGEETIETPAGTFQTFKIQGKGIRDSPGRSRHYLKLNYWFSPQVKAMVRINREIHSADGTLIGTLSEVLKKAKVK